MALILWSPVLKEQMNKKDRRCRNHNDDDEYIGKRMSVILQDNYGCHQHYGKKSTQLHRFFSPLFEDIENMAHVLAGNAYTSTG